MGYDIITFLKNRIQDFKLIRICKQKGFPLKVLIACDVDILTLPDDIILNHPVGVVISSFAKIGNGCNIKQNVTIGAKYPDTANPEYPTVGNHVLVGAGSVIIGNITVGDYATIGAGSIVLKDVPAGATVTGVWK
ncbi:serine O-acetyltransferase [Methanococcoides methylutens]|uniref:serine O-acetyltransferase n=1 Tax=Methanococcoides methylutens TaxID=2226 RepID=UPI00064F43BB|nr:hypothetical protein [Methanococcoides methylutens]